MKKSLRGNMTKIWIDPGLEEVVVEVDDLKDQGILTMMMNLVEMGHLV
jgi:hypothetical protein